MRCDSCGKEVASRFLQRFVLGKTQKTYIEYSPQGQRQQVAQLGDFKDVEVGLCDACLARKSRNAKRLSKLYVVFAVMTLLGGFLALVVRARTHAADSGRGGFILFIVIVAVICIGVSISMRLKAGKNGALARDFLINKGLMRGYSRIWTPDEFRKFKAENEKRERDKLDALVGKYRPKR
jgi:hypothetical protein